MGVNLLNFHINKYEAMAKREKRNKSRGSAGNNRKMGEDFLEKNLRKEGVRETESGLQYLILEEGEGDCPEANANVTVHQRCQLVNGTVIEDTYRENETGSKIPPYSMLIFDVRLIDFW